MDFLPLPPVPEYKPSTVRTLNGDYYDDLPAWRYPAVPAKNIADPALWQPSLAQKADPITRAMQDYLQRSLPDWTVHPWKYAHWMKLPRGGYFELTHACRHGCRSFVTTTATLSHPLFALYYAPAQLLLHYRKHLQSELDSLTRLVDVQFRYYRALHTVQADALRSLGRLRVPSICRLDAIRFDAETISPPPYDALDFPARPLRKIQL